MRLGIAAALSICCAASSSAQEVPLRVLDVRDGLPQSRVNDVQRDRLGYVWFATWEGAGRFDGRSFVHFGARQGLPNPLVWCAVEGPDGTIWLGTHGGGAVRVAGTGNAVLAEPASPRNGARHVYEIAFDRDGRMWLASNEGLFVNASGDPGRLELARIGELEPDWFGRPFTDARGELWFAASGELVRTRGGGVERWPYSDEGELGDLGEVRAAAPRRGGGAWVAHIRTLVEVDLPSEEGAVPVRRIHPLDLPTNTALYDVAEDSAGCAWVATTSGLARIEGGTTRWITAAQGLPEDWVRTVEPDQGGLWIGMHQAGAAWLADSGVELYSARSGLGDGHAVRLLPLGEEAWLVTTEVAGVFALEGGRARRIAGTERPPFDRIQQSIAWDDAGSWWVGTDAGIYRIRGPRFELGAAEPLAGEAGLPHTATRVLGLGRTGEVLVACEDGRLFARGRGADRFEALPIALDGRAVRDYVEHPDGSQWLSEQDHLWRRRGAALERVEPWGGGELPRPRALLVDARGWLWVGTRFGGLTWTREPAAETPVFERLTSREGLSSDGVFALLEEPGGALLIGTGRGIQRYEPESGALQVLGGEGAQGLEWINHLALGADGALWAAAVNGVARIPLRAMQAPRVLPRVRFMRCTVAGAEIELPSGGALEGPSLSVSASDSRVSVEYVAVDPIHGQDLSYQTRLEGLDVDWSAPARERSARFGQLAPGSYRFHVRAFDPQSGESSEPSSLGIEVVPPWWRHPAFAALALGFAAALGWAAQRAHLARRLAEERLRTRIASDLHDDLGAGLAQIAISSELSRRGQGGEARDLMGEVAQLARDLRGSMSELVWAIEGRDDSLAEVVLRMRHTASELLAGDGCALAFDAPPEAELAAQSVPPDARRHLALWFKEAVVNAARHARASRFEVALELRPGRLALRVRDDGCGFDLLAEHAGQGLRSLERRARELGGTLAIESAPGHGTRIELEVPLERTPWRSALRRWLGRAGVARVGGGRGR